MNSKRWLLSAALAATMTLAGCAKTAAPDAAVDPEAAKQALIQADSAYYQFNMEHGFRAATERFMDFENGFLIEPGRGFVRTREPIMAERRLNVVPSTVHWTPEGALVSKSDDLGITWGGFRVVNGAKGSYVTIWRRGADGEWKFVSDIAVDDPPLAEQE